MDLSFIKGFIKGLEIQENFNRNNKIKEAHGLAVQGRFEEALDILENLRLSSNEKSCANVTGYLLKAVCYAELEYNQSARNSINVILNLSRFSINPFYQRVIGEAKEKARNIAKEYNL